jgi:ankyrin repeat protein
MPVTILPAIILEKIKYSEMKNRLLLLFTFVISCGRMACQEHYALPSGLAGQNIEQKLPGDSNLVSARDADGRTPLHRAARSMDIDELRFLIENGADVNARDCNNITALASAASRNHLEAVQLLLSKGASPDVTDNNGETPLHYAAAGGYENIVRLLINHGADPGLRNSYGRTPLLLAARESGNLATVRMLVAGGADVNAEDRNHDTPLTLAAWRGYEEVVNYLIGNNAKVPVTGPKTRLLFEYALNRKLLTLYSKMIDNGADINVLGRNGSTALHWAAKGGSGLIAEDLISKGLNVNEPDMFGMTPLHYASKYNRPEVIRILLENGADINTRTRMEETPLDLALKSGGDEAAGYLTSHGAGEGSKKYTRLRGRYFGQGEPGTIAEIFAPGIISNMINGHSNVTFSPDGKEALWTESNETDSGYPDGCKILYSRIENGYWTIPMVVVKKGDVPVFSCDGDRVYFRATLTDQEGHSHDEIRYCERTSDGLLPPQTLDFDLAGTGLYWQFTFDRNDNIYFSAGNRIFRSLHTGEGYSAPEDLAVIMNPGYHGGPPFISPDCDYIIFPARNTEGDFDLYAGFKKYDGTWTNPISLGSGINTAGNEYLPMVSGDGKYLFFVSNRIEGDFLRFRVSAKIIKKLKRGIS